MADCRMGAMHSIGVATDKLDPNAVDRPSPGSFVVECAIDVSQAPPDFV